MRVLSCRFLITFEKLSDPKTPWLSIMARTARNAMPFANVPTPNMCEMVIPNPIGVIVFESGQDLLAETIYSCYVDRWLLELVFGRYKNDECLDHSNVQGDFSVIGSEFINFIATVLTCRMVRQAEKTGLLQGAYIRRIDGGFIKRVTSKQWKRTSEK